LVYNAWSDRNYTIDSNILINLNGTSNLVLDYYENGGNNRISLNNVIPIIENKLGGNLNQTVCSGGVAEEISGDTFPQSLPNRITSPGYQWTYSTSRTGQRR